jgi:hypothetical protein
MEIVNRIGGGGLLKTYKQKINLEPKWGRGMRKF